MYMCVVAKQKALLLAVNRYRPERRMKNNVKDITTGRVRGLFQEHVYSVKVTNYLLPQW